MKLGIYTLAIGASLTAGFARAEDTVNDERHWDVAHMRSVVKEKGLTFEVSENWVTRFLARGGLMKDVTGLVQPAGAKFAGGSVRHVDLAPDADLPASFDWRDEVAGGLQPVRNQGSCGSCWAFALTGVVESLSRIKSPGEEVNLAEQTLVSTCERDYDCSGGYFDAFDYVQSKGLPNESKDPYQARNSRCKTGLSSEKAIKNWAYVGASGKSPTTEQIKTAIKTYGPVAVSVNGSFSSYSSGIYNRCNTAQIDHMVMLVGWNDADGGYWIMRNSWGSSWGEQGYMRIKYTDARGRKCNNIGDAAAFAELAD